MRTKQKILLAITGLCLSSPAVQAQNNEDILKTVPISSFSSKDRNIKLHDPSSVIVTFKSADHAKRFVNKIRRQNNRVRGIDRKVTLRKILPTLYAITIRQSQKEKNSQGSPYVVIGKNNKEAATLNNRLLQILKQDGDVDSVERNTVHSAHQWDLNDIIQGKPSPDDQQNSSQTENPEYYQQELIARQTSQAKFPNDQYFGYQWHLKMHGSTHDRQTSPGASNFPLYWRENTGSSDQVIAIIDTGILFSHPDFNKTGRILPGYDFITRPFTSNDGDGRDGDATDTGDASKVGECYKEAPASPSNWHGSHVAGIAAAFDSNNSKGLSSANWGARILPVRVLGKCGGTALDIFEGVLWAAGETIQGVPVNKTPARIINMSLGGHGMCPKAMQIVFDTLYQKGVSVVVAAGNAGTDASQYWPASCKHVITVAASDARGHLTPYSNFGPRVDIMAPGGDLTRDDNGDGKPDGILSAVKGGYAFYPGTSMAAPMVSAAVALLKSQQPNLSPEDVLKTLKSRAFPRTSMQCGKLCGAGLLNMSQDANQTQYSQNR